MTTPRFLRRIASTLAAVLLLTACSAVRGSGTVTPESRTVHGFTEVELGGSGHLVIQQTGTESLTITAEDNILPLLTSDVTGGRLNLGTKPNTAISATKPIEYRLTVKDLTGLTVSGSGKAELAQLRGTDLTVTLSGSGTIVLGRQVQTQTVTVSGSGAYQADKLASQTATVNVSGSGAAEVQVSQTLRATVSGSGSIVYSGNPQVEQHISGSGGISKRSS